MVLTNREIGLKIGGLSHIELSSQRSRTIRGIKYLLPTRLDGISPVCNSSYIVFIPIPNSFAVSSAVNMNLVSIGESSTP